MIARALRSVVSENVRLDPAPDALACAECGETIETGYLPVVDAGDRHEPLVEAALCGACGFTAVGMNGCAPRLGDFDVDADALVRIEDGATPASVTDRA